LMPNSSTFHFKNIEYCKARPLSTSLPLAILHDKTYSALCWRLRRRAKFKLHKLLEVHFFVHLGRILGAQAQLRIVTS
jgi:hypothetical protein